jgi:mannose-6-phosphate isomerase
VRAGLTPKLRDVDTLLSMLTYTSLPADEQVLQPQRFRRTKYTKLYDPPIEEFAVLLTELELGQEDNHGCIAGPSILIVTEGCGALISQNLPEAKYDIQPGEIFFIGADTPVTLVASGNTKLTAFRAFVERSE